MSKENSANTIPEAVRSSFDRLLGFYMSATEKILQKDKAVIPIAARIDPQGEPAFVALAPADEGSNQDMIEYLRAYRTLLVKQYPDDQSHLLSYDVSLKQDPDYSDALAIELQSNDYQVLLHLPYRFEGLRKKLAFGPIRRVEPGKDRLF